jgi:hypothetical protein
LARQDDIVRQQLASHLLLDRCNAFWLKVVVVQIKKA